MRLELTTHMNTTHSLLTSEQLDRFKRDGYLVVPDLLTDTEIVAFLKSLDQPHPAGWGGLRTHLIDPQFRYLAHHPKITGMIQQLVDGPARIVQSMSLDKPPKLGKGIALHQDIHYLPNDPNTLTACWLALSDTDGDNGGLCVVPGSHTSGRLDTHRAENSKEHDSFEAEYPMRDRDGREWSEKMFRFEIDGLDLDKVVRLSVPRGAGVFFTGLTIHGSFGNHSPDRPRRAFATHYVREGTWLFRKDVQETVPVEPIAAS
jgi:ectoine hydroxylase-related dioxygenase (phytanoyl-CoA dioxygenase family)